MQAADLSVARHMTLQQHEFSFCNVSWDSLDAMPLLSITGISVAQGSLHKQDTLVGLIACTTCYTGSK